MYWPGFRILQHVFSTIVSKLSEVLSALTPAQFDSLLASLPKGAAEADSQRVLTHWTAYRPPQRHRHTISVMYIYLYILCVL